MRLFWIDDFINGSVGMMARPKGGEDLTAEIAILKKQKVDYVICLIEDSEMFELDLICEEDICKASGIGFIHFPIKDYHLPEKSAYLELLEHLTTLLNQNKKIVIHCRAGIGRTSTIVAGLVIKANLTSDDVFSYISKKRTLSVPDTTEQKEWVYRMENEILNN